MEDRDKTIEVVKAAMEKEKKAKQAEKSMDKKIDKQAENKETKDSDKTLQEDIEKENKDEEDEVMEETSCAKDGQNVTGEEASAKEQAVSGEEKVSEEETVSDDEQPGKEKSPKSGKSFFKSSKNKELEAKDQKIQELTDKLLRTMAEFDNYRKRTEKEKSQMFDLGVKSVIEKLLPVVDNFERGLSAINEADKDSALAQGYNMIYKQLMTMLENMGVKPIEAVGKEFDPNYHNAVMHSEDENLGENIVAEEFQKGYMYNDMVVRHSMVRVAN